MPASSPQSQTQSESNKGHEPHKEKPAPKSKRARPTISCLECRRKKLKCDRVQPCMQCTKSGKEALCTFANPPVKKTSQEILQHRPAEISNKRAKLDGLTSLETLAHSHKKSAQPLTPGAAQTEEYHCRGNDYLDNDCPWLNDSNGVERQDKRPGHVANGEKKCLGKIYIKNGRSRFLGVGDRMVVLDHVNAFLMVAYRGTWLIDAV